MSAQETKNRTDWLMPMAQMASTTVGVVILTEFIARHWRTIASALEFGS